jgi:hypothetical protein
MCGSSAMEQKSVKEENYRLSNYNGRMREYEKGER